jgi:CMP-N,N'-diacetyllegionaminic acid synthase
MKILGIIPARGGSKGVLRKNIRMLGGRPLIAHTIEPAKQSSRLTQLVLSTEDHEIYQIAKGLGVKVLLRPMELALDATLMVDVTLHALDQIPGPWDAVMILQPTCPFRTNDDIDKAIELMENEGVDSVVSVCPVDDHHPARMYTMDHSCLVPLDSAHSTLNRQDLPPVFHRNGLIYLCRTGLVRQEHRLWGDRPAALVLPADRSLNIDTEMDLKIAELLISQN